MSNAPSKNRTPEQTETRRERRQETKARRASRRQAIHDWLEERRIQAAKAKAERIKAKAEREPRGRDRVPAFVQGNPLQRKPRNSGGPTRQQRRQQLRDAAKVPMLGQHARPAMRQRPPRPRELADRALSKMTEPELKEFLRVRQQLGSRHGRDLTGREETNLAYRIMEATRVPAGAR